MATTEIFSWSSSSCVSQASCEDRRTDGRTHTERPKKGMSEQSACEEKRPIRRDRRQKEREKAQRGAGGEASRASTCISASLTVGCEVDLMGEAERLRSSAGLPSRSEGVVTFVEVPVL